MKKANIISITIAYALISQNSMASFHFNPFNSNKSHKEVTPVIESKTAMLSPQGLEQDFNIKLHQALDKNQYDQYRSLLKPSSLMKIIKDKEHGKLKTLIEYVPEAIHYQDADGNSALHWAARLNDITAIDILLDHGAPLYLKNRHGFNPCQWADKNHIGRSYGYLTHTMANLEHQLISAIMNHDLPTTKRTVNNGANVNFQDINGNHSLNIAIQNGYTNIALFLIDHGANINLANWQGSTPLHEASFHGRLDMVKALIRKNAKINLFDEQKMTALHNAALNGHHQIVQFLISEGANTETKDIYNKSPLDDARRNNHSVVIKLLNPNDDLDDKNHFEWLYKQINTLSCKQLEQKVLHLSAHRLQELINHPDDQGRTSLHIAAAKGDHEKIAWLIKHGAQINALKHDQESPLHEAVWEGQASSVEVLLKNGISVDQPNKFGLTALHISAWKGLDNISALLLQHKANPNALNQHGWTPLHYAIKYKNNKVAKMLLRHGSNTGIAEKKHKLTPVQMAKAVDNKEMLKWIENLNKSHYENMLKLTSREKDRREKNI